MKNKWRRCRPVPRGDEDGRNGRDGGGGDGVQCNCATMVHKERRNDMMRVFFQWLIWFATQWRPAGWEKVAVTTYGRDHIYRGGRCCARRSSTVGDCNGADSAADNKTCGRRAPSTRKYRYGNGGRIFERSLCASPPRSRPPAPPRGCRPPKSAVKKREHATPRRGTAAGRKAPAKKRSPPQ